jgi:hypothetical protein
VFTRQNRGKLDALTRLVERGLVKPVIGATLPLARMGEGHDLLENGTARGLRGKVTIDVTGEALALPPVQRAAGRVMRTTGNLLAAADGTDRGNAILRSGRIGE